MKQLSLLGLASLVILFINSTALEAATGRWYCQEARQFPGNLASSNELRSFEMIVYPDGTVQGGGQVQIVNGAVFPYQFAGRWQQTGANFYWTGQSSIGGGAQMEFASRLLDNATMAWDRVEAGLGIRLSSTCRRLN